MQINYKIVRSSRKTFSVSIERDGSVIAHAPNDLSEERIRDLIDSKRSLIVNKINDPRKISKTPIQKEFVSGEGLLYLGHIYNLDVVDETLKDIEFDTNFRISKNNRSKANDIFKTWYKERAKEIIPPIVHSYAKNIGVSYKKCNILEMKYRWGSCMPSGNINFNWRLMKAPLFVIQYVVVHELAHIRIPNHSQDFWTIVSVQVPEYQKAKDWLKKNGEQLEIDF